MSWIWYTHTHTIDNLWTVPRMFRRIKITSTRWNRHWALCTRTIKEYQRVLHRQCSSKMPVLCTSLIYIVWNWINRNQNSRKAVHYQHVTTHGWPSLKTAFSCFTWVQKIITLKVFPRLLIVDKYWYSVTIFNINSFTQTFFFFWSRY